MHENSATIFYIDPATISKDGNFRKVWEVQDLKQRGRSGEMSRRFLSEYDCKEERSRLLTRSAHSERMTGGKLLVMEDSPTEWSYIAPGTVGGFKLKVVCSK